jgi:hypothetical protein
LLVPGTDAADAQGRPLLRTRADDVASWRVLVTVPHGSSAASMPIIFRLLDPENGHEVAKGTSVFLGPSP